MNPFETKKTPLSSVLLMLGIKIPEDGIKLSIESDFFLLKDALQLVAKGGLSLRAIDDASLESLKKIDIKIAGERLFTESMADELKFTLKNVIDDSGIKLLN